MTRKEARRAGYRLGLWKRAQGPGGALSGALLGPAAGTAKRMYNRTPAPGPQPAIRPEVFGAAAGQRPQAIKKQAPSTPVGAAVKSVSKPPAAAKPTPGGAATWFSRMGVRPGGAAAPAAR